MIGYCPMCGAEGRSREKRPEGNDVCEAGHSYPSRRALAERPGSLPTGGATRTRYVGGFLFSGDGTLVVLICKAKPTWMAGLLNGVGGKIEPRESAGRAMAREFFEETGVLIPIQEWDELATLTGPDFHVQFFSAFVDAATVLKVTTAEDKGEKVQVYATRHVLQAKNLASTVRALIPLALDDSGVVKPVHFTAMLANDRKAA